MFQPKEGPRQAALEKLETAAVRYFRESVQTAARKQGVAHARAVVDQLGAGQSVDLNDSDTRRKILLDGQRRATSRVRIFQAAVNDRANTLDNRLTAYWLEPGADVKEKLAKLKGLHADNEARRIKYERGLADFYAGREDKRPSTPNLDFMSRLTNGVKQSAMEQARRSGTDAETETFVKAGETQLAWITVNAAEACVDCRGRQGVVGNVAYFDTIGRPGSGQTRCGARCFCMLSPARILTQFPSLSTGLNVPGRLP